MRRALSVYGLISLVLSATLIFGAVAMFRSLADYHNPYPVRQDFAANSHGPALVQHVVLAVIDGLRVDTAQTMRAFRPAPGAIYRGGELTVSLPSYSLPTWTVIGTGTTQAVTGVVMNGYRQPVISNVFAKAKAAGLTTALVGSGSWDTLYGPWLDDKFIFSGELAEAEIARRAADLAHTAALTLAYFPRPDDMAHAFGAASQQYAGAARATDEALLQLLASVDLSTTTVIITADHGHVRAGGHGGPEPDVVRTPLIIYGAAVKPGAPILGRQMDIAPTVAALLGTGYPDFVQGEPLLDALDCTPLDRALILTAWADQVEKGTAALLPALNATLRPVSATDPQERGRAYIRQYDDAAAAVRAADMGADWRRLAFAALCAAALLLAARLRRYTTLTCFMSSVAGLTAAALVAALGKLRPTFTVLDGPQQVVLTLSGYAAAGLLVTLVLMLIEKGRGRPVLFRQWAFGMVQVQVIVFGAALAMLTLGPCLVSGYMPDFGYWLLKLYLVAYAALSNLVLLIGLLPVWLIARWAARSAIDSPTRIAPAPGAGQPR